MIANSAGQQADGTRSDPAIPASAAILQAQRSCISCDIVIPRTKLDALTYSVADELAEKVRVGSAVRVELRKKQVKGVVVAVRSESPSPLEGEGRGEGKSGIPSGSRLKPILEVIEEQFCDRGLLRLTNWVSQYYIASWGETFSLTFPGRIIGYRPRKPREVPAVSVASGKAPTLTLEQMHAVRAILKPLKQGGFRPFLVFGVTGSGKTEIYLRVVEEALRLGKSAIVLVPEIALTPLLTSRFEERFPGQLVALHSGLRDAERKQDWQLLRDGKVRLVVGARSAVFAPVKNLGAIVVDEEHDHSYKEHERSPHYNARDVAVMRAKHENAVAVLASATPSVESFHNARRGVYELLELPRRIGDRPLPKAAIVNMRGKAGRTTVFSPALVSAIKARMGTPEQVILFVNRRGFAGQLVCTDCGYVPVCKYCGVPLVYHRAAQAQAPSASKPKPQATGEGWRMTNDQAPMTNARRLDSAIRIPQSAFRNLLECHFCKHTEPAFDSCPACRGDNLDCRGVGTQMVVQQLRRLVPGANVLRLDSETTEAPGAHQKILDAYARGDAKFLVGTQMVTKGFDFPRVTLCAVVSADSLLAMPDFRSAERTFQVLTQVAGRAGRGDIPGQAIFQTLHTDNYAVNCAAGQNYVRFYDAEIKQREELNCPPFTRLALVRIMSFDPELCVKVGEFLRERFGSHPGVQALGPIPAFRKKKRNLHIYLLLLRAKAGIGFSSIIDRKLLDFPRVRIDLDIDPLEVL